MLASDAVSAWPGLSRRAPILLADITKGSTKRAGKSQSSYFARLRNVGVSLHNARAIRILDRSANFIEKSVKGIEFNLRNPIAHGAEYAQTRDAALKTIRAARATRDWIRELQHAIGPGPNELS
jgi:hypothetical protein